jgi:hypothetical protein
LFGFSETPRTYEEIIRRNNMIVEYLMENPREIYRTGNERTIEVFLNLTGMEDMREDDMDYRRGKEEEEEIFEDYPMSTASPASPARYDDFGDETTFERRASIYDDLFSDEDDEDDEDDEFMEDFMEDFTESLFARDINDEDIHFDSDEYDFASEGEIEKGAKDMEDIMEDYYGI